MWSNLQFWEAAFYQDVQKEIRQLYAPQYEENILMEMKRASGDKAQSPPTKTKNVGDDVICMEWDEI